MAGLRQIGWVEFRDGKVWDFTDDRTTFLDDSDCVPVYVADAGEVKTSPTPTDDDSSFCPHCATCGHWRTDHLNLNSAPRPCHHDDGCKRFKQPTKPCDFCSAPAGQFRWHGGGPNWPENSSQPKEKI